MNELLLIGVTKVHINAPSSPDQRDKTNSLMSVSVTNLSGPLVYILTLKLWLKSSAFHLWKGHIQHYATSSMKHL